MRSNLNKNGRQMNAEKVVCVYTIEYIGRDQDPRVKFWAPVLNVFFTKLLITQFTINDYYYFIILDSYTLGAVHTFPKVVCTFFA